jgi:hypothetical protein
MTNGTFVSEGYFTTWRGIVLKFIVQMNLNVLTCQSFICKSVRIVSLNIIFYKRYYIMEKEPDKLNTCSGDLDAA